MSQRGFWDEQERITKFHNKNPILKLLAEKVPRKLFLLYFNRLMILSAKAAQDESGLIR
jgi:hypothetical protein